LTILEEIFAFKKEEIAAAKRVISPEKLRAEADRINHRRGFRAALIAANKPALIAEVKKASPSMGVIRENFDPIMLAKDYEAAGATCLSILTDVKYFKGSPSYLGQIRDAVKIPLLRKDFICDPYQLDEAIVWGADCVLLIVAGLPKAQLTDLYAESKHRNLDVLVEVHDEDELKIAIELGADMIGVNNRDLRTFKTQIETSELLIPKIPAGVLSVSESALDSNENVKRVKSDAVLIGTAFCQEQDVPAKVKAVMGW
jgi:indole-3-glycerol phosphate synthase